MSNNQLSLKKQLIDQSAHMVAAGVILFPLLASPSIITAGLAGAGMGIIREITEQGNPVSLAKIKSAFDKWSVLDIAFWALGGSLAWLLIA